MSDLLNEVRAASRRHQQELSAVIRADLHPGNRFGNTSILKHLFASIQFAVDRAIETAFVEVWPEEEKLTCLLQICVNVARESREFFDEIELALRVHLLRISEEIEDAKRNKEGDKAQGLNHVHELFYVASEECWKARQLREK